MGVLLLSELLFSCLIGVFFSQSRWLCYLTPCQMFSFFSVCVCTWHRKAGNFHVESGQFQRACKGPN